MTTRFIFVLIIIFLFFSCSKQELLSERELWKSLNISNYTMTQQISCYCFPEDFVLPKTIVVENDIIKTIAKKIKVFGGFILFSDYGYSELKLKSTLSSMKNNKTTSFLSNLGEQDLTAHVNFKRINEIFKNHNIENLRTVKQSEFLKQMGIELRASKLIKSNPIKEKEILSGMNRLIDLGEMGSLFKIIYTDYK